MPAPGCSSRSGLPATLPRKTSPMSQMPMFALGGRLAEVPNDATACSGSRSTRWALTVVGVTPDRESLLAEREWARAFWQALRPHARSDGVYINFLGTRIRTGCEPPIARRSTGAWPP